MGAHTCWLQLLGCLVCPLARLCSMARGRVLLTVLTVLLVRISPVFLPGLSIEPRTLRVSADAKAKKSPESLEPPKRPLTSFLRYMQEMRPSIVKKLPKGAPVSEVAKEGGRKWRGLSAAKKKPYEEAAEEEWDEYREAMAEFKAQGGVMPVKKKRGAKKQRDPNMPKRPLSAYILFMMENRPKIVKSLPADAKVTEVMKEAGKQWRALTAAKKKKYETEAAKLKKEYAKEMDAYKAQLA